MSSASDEQSVPLAERIGAQRPRIELLPSPLFVTDFVDDSLDLAEEAGIFLDEWQEYVYESACSKNDRGKWAATEVALNVPRQNGKNATLEVRELAGLFLLGEFIVHSAHDFATADNAFQSLNDAIRRTPSLVEQVVGYRGDADGRMSGIKQGNMDRSISVRGNGRKPAIVKYRTRTKGGGRGLAADLVILDEAFALAYEHVGALMPLLASKSIYGDPQVWYTSSAGLPDSYVLEDLRQRAVTPKNTDSRFAYFEWSADKSAEPDDVDAWYQANPALGIRISESYIRETERGLLNDEQFRRERLGIWADLGGDPVVDMVEWAALAAQGPLPRDRVSFGVDVTPSRDAACISAAVLVGSEIHVQVVEHRAGTTWVASRVKELKEKWSPVGIGLDTRGGGRTLVDDFNRKHIRFQTVHFADYQASCARVYDYIKERKLRHYGGQLDDAVEHAIKRMNGDSGAWCWARQHPNNDISPLVAATNAVYALLKRTHGELDKAAAAAEPKKRKPRYRRA